MSILRRRLLPKIHHLSREFSLYIVQSTLARWLRQLGFQGFAPEPCGLCPSGSNPARKFGNGASGSERRSHPQAPAVLSPSVPHRPSASANAAALPRRALPAIFSAGTASNGCAAARAFSRAILGVNTVPPSSVAIPPEVCPIPRPVARGIRKAARHLYKPSAHASPGDGAAIFRATELGGTVQTAPTRICSREKATMGSRIWGPGTSKKPKPPLAARKER